MNNKAKRDLIFDVVMKVLWLGLAGAIYILTFQKMEGFVYGTLGLDGSVWTLVVGVTSYHVARVFNSLYDGAFD